MSSTRSNVISCNLVWTMGEKLEHSKWNIGKKKVLKSPYKLNCAGIFKRITAAWLLSI